jgi:hypothetical protein
MAPPDDQATRQQGPDSKPTPTTDPPTAPLTWAQRLKRVFESDISLCPHCGGQLRVIGHVTDPDLIRKILDHIQQCAPPRLPPRRVQRQGTNPDMFFER